MAERFGLLVRADAGPGVLHQLTGVIAQRRGDIASVEIAGERAAGADAGAGEARVYFEIELPDDEPAVLADAVRALPIVRDVALVNTLQTIYGKRIIIMGGDIERAVREVRAQGLLVVSLNMAGSVPDAADLVVTDPVQAGVMTVMAVANTAKFTVERLKRRVF